MCRGFASEFKATTLIKSTALQRAAGAGGIRFVTMTTHRTVNSWALNSAVECHLHTVEVIGSNPIAPTIPARYGPLHPFLDAHPLACKMLGL